jgi:long-chain-fatty-acyl-CoA reductase
MSVHELPIVVCGERIEPAVDVHRFGYGEDLEIVIPVAPDDTALRIATAPREPLRNTPVDDLAIFFDEVARHWTDPTNEWRQRAIELGPSVTGYAESMIVGDVEYMGRGLNRAKQYEFLAGDLGDPYLLDEWRPFQAVYQRCWPRGLVAHILVGNVPLVGLFAFYRSLITKNVTVAKIPKRDVVSALCFANCVIDVDPDHPASRALTTLYWKPGSDLERDILVQADVISAWGRDTTIEAAKKHACPGTELIDFGPKRSFAVVLEGVEDGEDLVRRLALDIVMYDQEACFSCQEVYCAADPVALAQDLGRVLERFERVTARRELDLDQHAHIQRARIEAMANGWRVSGSERTEWTVIVTDGAQELPEHPLGRCVYIHPIKDVEDVVALVDNYVQTVSVAPWSRAMEIGDKLTAVGADRIVPPGRMGRFRPGLSHDGFHPMRRMVRWSALERDGSFKYHFASGESAEAERRRLAAVDSP